MAKKLTMKLRKHTPSTTNDNAMAECSCCAIAKFDFEFPESTPTSCCDHPVKTCTECFETWVSVKLDTSYQPRVECPNCEQHLLARRDLKDMPKAQNKCFEIYRRIGKSKIPSWRWCFEEGCMMGSVHVSAAMQEEDNEQEASAGTVQQQQQQQQQQSGQLLACEEPNIWTCPGSLCPGQACVTCDRPWHFGISCSEYARRNFEHLMEDALSRKVIELMRAEGKIKDCANCQCAIEKDGPGDEVFCTMCLCRFRWDEA